MEPWVLFTMLAVAMQAVRTAGQKQIANSISVQATTLVRFLFGLPFAWFYFIALKAHYQIDSMTLPSAFVLWAGLAALSQIFATLLLVKALNIRNFAVGTALAKTEALLAAVIGAWFFSESLNWIGYLSVLLGVSGALVTSKWTMTLNDLRANKSIQYGFGAGLGFSIASVLIREASLSLHLPSLYSASATLVFMVSIQTLICLCWVVTFERSQLILIARHIKASVFIGFTSVVGSIGWFTAMSMQNAALVKTLGQTEFLLALAITHFYFAERISLSEYLGIILIASSVILLVLFA